MVDILQAKVDELLIDIKGVKIYIDDTLVLIKESFYKNMEKMSTLFGRLRAAGLKINDPKCILGLKEIIYLRYVITQEGIKPYPKKVQGIMDPGRPTTMTKA